MAKGILIHNGSVIEGNAIPSDVLSGKTFMSENSDDLQTGTLIPPTAKEVVVASSHWDNATGQSICCAIVKKDGTIIVGQAISGDYFQTTVPGNKYVNVIAKTSVNCKINRNSSISTANKNANDNICSVGGYNPSSTDIVCAIAL